MRKVFRVTKKCVALFLFVALFSSALQFDLYASYNDERFNSYENMNPDDDKPGYVVPTLYRQDAVYQYVKTFPLVVSGGVEYVPISLFTQFSYLSVTYSKTSDNFYMSNSETGRFVTFDVRRNIAETDQGHLIKIITRLFYRTRYIPVKDVAEIFDLTVEIYDNKEMGVYAVRLCDSSRKYTLSQLMENYLPKKIVPQVRPEPVIKVDPDDNQPSGDGQNPVVPKPVDPYEKVAKRNFYPLFENISSPYSEELINTLSYYNQGFTFVVKSDEVIQNSGKIRAVLVGKGTLAVSADEGLFSHEMTPLQYAQKLVQEFEKANKALSVVCKQKTRLCVLPRNIDMHLLESKDFLSVLDEAGYVVVRTDFAINDYPENANISPYTVVSDVKKAIVDCADKNKEGTLRARFFVGAASKTYAAEISRFINKYSQFSSYSINETSFGKTS